MSKQKSKAITEQTRLMALGLFTMAHQHYKKCREFEVQLAELLGYEDTYAGHLSDELGDDGDFAGALKKEGFVVKPARRKR